MRDVKFRGQSKQTGAWLYGSLIRRGERCFILPFTGKMRAAEGLIEIIKDGPRNSKCRVLAERIELVASQSNRASWFDKHE